MTKDLKDIKVAIVGDHCFGFAGASSVSRCIGQMFSSVDYFFLMGYEQEAKRYFKTERVFFSKLNRLPFLKRYYRYTLFLWPIFIESFDFSEYDLVISNSFSVAHGVIVPVKTKHISYIHTPMRYIWDLYNEYFSRSFVLKRIIVGMFVNFLRIWDISASERADLLIANSTFVQKRIFKYWRKKCDYLLHPPVKIYEGEIRKKREPYFLSGAPFDENKGGEFLFECAKELGFNLKVIGKGLLYKRFKRMYSGVSNIEFLGRVSEKEKERFFSKAFGFIGAGVEDFGIFPIEALSFGTPVLAYMESGYMDGVVDGVNGVFFKEMTLESFKEAMDRFKKIEWDRGEVSASAKRFSTERFKMELERIILKNI